MTNPSLKGVKTIQCPECGKPTKVTDGRPFSGIYKRRRVCPDNHVTYTYEILSTAPDQIIEAIQWLCSEALSEEDLEFIPYTIKRILLGLPEE